MCTAVSFNKTDHYFGRTLDYDVRFGDSVVITPRKFRFETRFAGALREHYAMIGMAHVAGGYPLYYDCVNEKGLAMAGLNFVGNAFYGGLENAKTALCPHEFIPFVLGTCADLSEARELLRRVCLVDEPVGEGLPAARLHWMISDKSGSIVVESTEKGFFVYDDPFGVLTNNPEFPMQLMNLNNYMGLSAMPPQNRFCESCKLTAYSRGMGAIGLPGDWSSASRFVRAAFVRANSVCGVTESECVAHFFHILSSVEVPSGCCRLEDGSVQITQYSCCCNCDKGVYYYKYRDDHRISAVDMHREKLDASELVVISPDGR